jgi:hypothetical protein
MISLGIQSVSISSLAQQLAVDPDLLRELLREVCRQSSDEDSVRSPPTRERVDDGPRLQRMGELIGQGAQKHPAARQACRENPAGASLEACERRIVRKYDDKLRRHRLP